MHEVDAKQEAKCGRVRMIQLYASWSYPCPMHTTLNSAGFGFFVGSRAKGQGGALSTARAVSSAASISCRRWVCGTGMPGHQEAHVHVGFGQDLCCATGWEGSLVVDADGSRSPIAIPSGMRTGNKFGFVKAFGGAAAIVANACQKS